MGQNFYQRDDRDMHFVLKEQLGIERLLQFDDYRDFSLDDFAMILKEAGKIAAEEVAPTFQDGDREGCRFDKGRMSVPESFHRCWQVFREGGWFALERNPAYGGQGLPSIIAEAAQELFISANIGFISYAGMGVGNGYMIGLSGLEEQKNLFLEKM